MRGANPVGPWLVGAAVVVLAAGRTCCGRGVVVGLTLSALSALLGGTVRRGRVWVGRAFVAMALFMAAVQ